MRDITTLVIHCSDTETGTAEAIHDYHVKHNGWDGLGYHYMIELEGNVKKGRPEYWQGAHTKSINAESIGICLIGVKEFDIKQIEMLKMLVDDIKTRYPDIKILGHYEVDENKTCPNMDMDILRYYLDTGKLDIGV